MAVVSVGMSSLLFAQEAGSPAELHATVLGVACELAGADPGLAPAAAGASAGYSAPQ
jgi:hypothetical protein